MQIGLIGGIGPAATDYYYRRLIGTARARNLALDLTIVHADTPTLLRHLTEDATDPQAAIFAHLTQRLHLAGAGLVAVTSIAGHFCRKAFEARSPLPVIDLITAVDQSIAQRGLKRVGILGTRTVMASRLYGGVTTAEVIAPTAPQRDAVHDAYVAMATAGTVTESQRAVFHAAAEQLHNQHGVEALMLGGTDLALVFSEGTSALPLIDCAAIHADAIFEAAQG